MHTHARTHIHTFPFDLLVHSNTNLLATVQPPLLMDPLQKVATHQGTTAEGGNTSGGPLLKVGT